MTALPRLRRARAGAAVAVMVGALLGGIGGIAPAQARTTGQVYLVQGLPGHTVHLYLNDTLVGSYVAEKAIVGPLSLASGNYDLRVQDVASSADLLDRSVSVTPGGNSDVVLHLDDATTPEPSVTVFPNDLSAVAAGSGRLAVAHAAAVGAADIHVGDSLVFKDVSNGQSAAAVAPSGSYSAYITAAGTAGPNVLGPATVNLAASKLTRVFAVGQPASKTMAAIVQTIPLTATTTTPTNVNTGSGGLATLTDSSHPLRVGLTWAGILFILAAGGLAWRRRTAASSEQ